MRIGAGAKAWQRELDAIFPKEQGGAAYTSRSHTLKLWSGRGKPPRTITIKEGAKVGFFNEGPLKPIRRTPRRSTNHYSVLEGIDGFILTAIGKYVTLRAIPIVRK